MIKIQMTKTFSLLRSQYREVFSVFRTLEHSNYGRDPVPCVSFLLVEGDDFLAECRKQSARIDPGAVALPGGHIEPGESLSTALFREIDEELAVFPRQHRYVCTLLHVSSEFEKIHYFWIPEWRGTPECREAETIEWLPLSGLSKLDLEVDRVAVREYLRLFRRAGVNHDCW